MTYATDRKAAILRMLETDFSKPSPHPDLMRGPFAAAEIARFIDTFGGENGRPDNDTTGLWRPSDFTVQSFSRTLRGMAKDGLVVAVRQKHPTYNALADNSIMMTRTVYYSPKTMERDIAHAEAEAIAEKARFEAAQKGAWVIDGKVIQ